MRKIILEGHRFAGPDLHAHHIVDVLSPAKGEQGGGAKTLETSIELAKKLAPKAAKDCYGSNKVSEAADERWRPDADEKRCSSCSTSRSWPFCARRECS